MGFLGAMSSTCDLLVRNSTLKSIAWYLVEIGHWEPYDPGSHTSGKPLPSVDCDADLVLQRTDAERGNKYQHLALWSETVYHISMDSCPVIEVPDFYPWHYILVEEK
jgi:hypothetical protein